MSRQAQVRTLSPKPERRQQSPRLLCWPSLLCYSALFILTCDLLMGCLLSLNKLSLIQFQLFVSAAPYLETQEWESFVGALQPHCD